MDQKSELIAKRIYYKGQQAILERTAASINTDLAQIILNLDTIDHKLAEITAKPTP